MRHCRGWLLSCLLAFRVYAQIPDKPIGYVTDSARVLTSVETKFLEARCSRFDKDHVAQIAIVTVRSLNGEPIDKVALALFRRWGIGRKGINDGILLMLAIEDRRSRLTVGYGMERLISNDTAASILQAMRPELTAAKYSAALNRALDSLAKILVTDRNQ